ncbi:MAG: HNH endonuclease [Deltaproteobacteria bacterium]|jgi:5-methylcytosine-specific restriction endonuclease McrA|nr:HNH endonuclease [Deltaproteobacteria bacterium]
MRIERQPKAFVLDRHKKPLDPCSRKRAHKLLSKGRARLHKRYPFTIRLVDRLAEDSVVHPLTLKLDPGSRATGAALVMPMDAGETEDGPAVRVISLFEIRRRGAAISKRLEQRRNYRRRRRSANLRYRAPRFLNRTRPAGWLPPSVRHRVDSVVSFTGSIMKLVPLEAIAAETVRFDMQKIMDPEISGTEYQQGTLLGYDFREYLLEKFGRKCSYCGKDGVPLQIDHVVPKARGGSDRVSNLTLACSECNLKKGSMDLKTFLAKKPDLADRILKRASAPLRDAAAVNATRWEIFNRLKDTGLPVSIGSGGLTKFNRTRFGIPKSHALDAACIGKLGGVQDWKLSTTVITCCDRGQYQRTNPDRHGFPRLRLSSAKHIRGFRTGDIVRAEIPKGKHAGTHVGRVAVRKSGSFAVTTPGGLISSSWRHCRLLQKGNGYGYETEPYRETSQL